MSASDGLFENPNQSPEQQNLETLNSIKEDTSAIREVIYKFGGKEIELMQSQLAQQKQHYKQVVKSQRQAVKTTQKNAKSSAEKHKQKSNFAKDPSNKTASQPTNINVLLSEHQKEAQQAVEQNSEHLKQLGKTLKKPIKAELPNGWGYDKQGRIRDKFGKYVSQDKLKKHGLHDKNKGTETEKEASDRRLLDALSGIKDVVETPQDFDPTINAMQELSAPFKRVFDIGKVGVDAGRGMGKAFGDTVKQSRWRERFSSLFRKSLRDSEKRENRMIDFLRKIWKKDDGSSTWLGKLLFFIPLLLRAFGSLTNGLKKFALFRGLLAVGKLLGGGAGKIFSPLGKLLVGAGRVVGGVGKGVLKRVPILGSLLAFKDNGMAGGIGAIVGGVLGSAFGPIGSIIGTLFGEQVGVWLAGLDWAAIGEWFKEKWNAITTAWEPIGNWFKEKWNVITEVWEPIGKWFQEQWESTLKFFSDIGNRILNFFKDLLPESVVKGVSNAVDTVKEYGGKAIDTVKEYSGKALDKAKEYAGNAGDWISEQWNSVANLFSSEVSENSSIHSEDNDEVSQKDVKIVANTSRLQSLLEDIKTTTIDTFNLLKDKLNNLIYPNGIDSAGVPIMTSVNGVSGIVSMAVNLAEETVAASDYAINNAAKASLGKCALYVNNALRQQGIEIQGHGKDVASNLLKSNQGFNEVKYDENYIPQIGDVMSMPSSSKSDHNYGHVAIFTEKGWVSDFVQGNKYGNTAAANQHYWNDIQSGRIKPTIARKSANIAQSAVQMAMNATRYTKQFSSNNGAAVDGLNQTETDALLGQVRSKESGGKTDAINSYGYLGLYQFGASALADIGLIDRKKYDQAVAKYGKGLSSGSNANLHKAFLEDESNWTLQGGQKAFLANKNVQDDAMIKLLNKNASYLGEAYSGDSKHKAGLLMAAHLKGAGAAKSYALNGKDSKDAYGTSVSSYYNAGYAAAKIATEVVANIHSVPAVESYAPIPQVPQLGYANNPGKIAEQVIKQTINLEKSNYPDRVKPINNKSSSDPIVSLLSQDVSERRIAHIVTGGIARA